MGKSGETAKVAVSYDVLFVGAGISSLYASREILKKHPTWRVGIAEKYKILGGRTSTYKYKGLQWEVGAGRISKDHTMLLKLVKEYNLTLLPIGEEISFLKDGQIEENPFESLYVPLYLEPLKNLDKEVLATHTIEQLLFKLIGQEKTQSILETFPYRAEVNTLRADLALDSFLKGEMKNHKGYYVLKEGFSALVDALVSDIESRGGVFLRQHTLLDVKRSGQSTDCLFHFGKKKEGGEIVLRAERACFLTLCRCHVAALPFLKNVPVLQYVRGKPLFRIYMVFPTVKGVSWFSGMGRIVTPSRLRYILPINPSKGVIMISYTDAEDTEFYAQYAKDEAKLEAIVLADARQLFPEKKIPKPLFTKAHYWDTGASYWVPGTYDPKVESRRAMRPLPDFPSLFMCGESWSLRQAWVEGALEHTDACLKESGILKN